MAQQQRGRPLLGSEHAADFAAAPAAAAAPGAQERGRRERRVQLGFAAAMSVQVG
jgi:hypothetical protein